MRQVRRCSRAGIRDVIVNTSVCADEGGDEDDEDEDNHGGGDDNDDEDEDEDEDREEEEEPLST